MPTRLLREGILTSERVDQLDASEEVFYRRLMSKVDDHGLYDARPSILRASLYPLRIDRVREADITRWMAACQKAGLIVFYEAESKPYLQMIDTKWQTRSSAKYPLPPESSCKQLQTPVHLDGVVVEGVVVVTTKAKAAPCPHLEILSLYGKHLPMGRQPDPDLWGGTRATHLQARWREKPERQNLAWWDEKFFPWIAESAFLTGKVPPSPGHKQFELSMDWIVKSENFTKILEGAYK